MELFLWAIAAGLFAVGLVIRRERYSILLVLIAIGFASAACQTADVGYGSVARNG